MDVGVKLKLARPGMQDNGDTELDAQAFGVFAKLEQRVGRGPEQQGKDVLAVEVSDRPQLGRQCRDAMEVAHGEDALLSLGDPLGLRQRLTRGAVSISTGVELIHLMATVQADAPMPAEKRSTAGLDCTHDLGLGVGHVVLLSVRRSKSAENVTDL